MNKLLKIFHHTFVIWLLTMSSVYAGNDLNTQAGKYGAVGFDPVSYIQDEKAYKGDKKWAADFQGVTYLFSTEANKKTFLESPEKYVPAYGGWCAYAMADGDEVEVDPKTFKIIDGKTHLYYNGLWGNTLKKWNKDETNLKSRADMEWAKRK